MQKISYHLTWGHVYYTHPQPTPTIDICQVRTSFVQSGLKAGLAWGREVLSGEVLKLKLREVVQPD